MDALIDSGWMVGWMDRWMKGWMDDRQWMDGWWRNGCLNGGGYGES